MSGLVWSAIGDGLGGMSNTMSSYLAREADREDRQEERRRELEERRAYDERRDALYRRTADQQTAAAASRGGGSRAREYTDDEIKTMAVGTGAFSSGPEVDAFRNSIKTGDFSQYKQDVTRGTVTDQGDPYNPDVTLQTTKEYPPGFETIVKKKAETLANISRESVQGKDLKDVNDGRDKGWELETKQGVLAGNIKPETFASAQAAEKGKLYDNTGESGTYNVATGNSSLNKLGEAKADEEAGKATKARAEAGKATADAGLSKAKAAAVKSGEDPDLDPNAKTADLQRQITSSKARLARELGVSENDVNATLLSLTKRNTPEAKDRLAKLKPFIDQYDGALQAMQEWRPGKTVKKPTVDAGSTSSGADLPEPKTAAEVSRLKPGTRFRAPDGSIRIR